MDKNEATNAMADMIETAATTWPDTITINLSAWIADVLVENGYRLDQYPNGKSKPELIEIVETLQGQLAKARNLLRSEHVRHIEETYCITMERHHVLKPDCEICRFLAETSTVTE